MVKFGRIAAMSAVILSLVGAPAVAQDDEWWMPLWTCCDGVSTYQTGSLYPHDEVKLEPSDSC